MATARVQQKVGPRLQQKPQVLVPKGPAREAALRLLSAERSEEIFPILLEEIVNLGFPRAAVLEVDYDTGDVKPTASLNTDKASLEKFRASLWASENPLVSVLHNVTPAVLPPTPRGESFYAYPR